MDQQEQNENLKDILGFDPNEADKSAHTLDITEQNVGLPADWRDKFHKAVLTQPQTDVIAKDPERLFDVSYNSGFEEVRRNFWRYRDHNNKGWFEIASEASFGKLYEDGSYSKIQLQTRADSNEFSSVSFLNKGFGQLVMFQRGGVGSRNMDVNYDFDGNLTEVTFSVTQWDGVGNSFPNFVVTRSSPDVPEFMCNGRLDVINNVDNERGVLALKRMEQGDIKDEMEVPLHVDVKKLKEDWLPDEMLRNPKIRIQI